MSVLSILPMPMDRIYAGNEVYADMPDPIERSRVQFVVDPNGLKAGDTVIVPFGSDKKLTRVVVREDGAGLCCLTGIRLARLHFDAVDRHCWTFE